MSTPPRQGAFSSTAAESGISNLDADLAALHAARDWPAFLKLAVQGRKTIMVAGGTATGKTTFANALLREVPKSERLIYIEDTPELIQQHQNFVGLISVRGQLGEAQVTTDDLLAASLRMRPDRIILGELRGAEAFTFLRAVNTGHPGSITTIHADSPERTIEQLALLMLRSHGQMRSEDVIRYASSVIDIIVQLERRDGHRRVAQVAWLENKRANAEIA